MKVADFGLCRVVKKDGSESSFSKSGTKGWMAPELYTKAPIRDEKAMFAIDIYSLGCIFAYALSKGNQHPYGTGNLRDYRMESKEEMILTLQDFDHYGGRGLFQLIRLMLSETISVRGTIQDVIQHAFFVDGMKEDKHSSFWVVSKDYEALITSLNQLEMDTTIIYDVKSKDSNGRTPLMLLFSKNASTIENQKNLLDYAEKFLHLPDVDTELVNTQDDNGNTALTLLCEHYNGDDLIDIIRILIQKGVDVNQATKKNGFNALMLLCMQYHRDNLIDIVRLFVETGANVNNKGTDDAWNVLHIICRYYNSEKLIEIIALLIAHGIELDAATTKNGWNAVIILCLFYTGERMLETIRLLIEKGISINHRACNGLNILGYLVCFYSRADLIDIIRMLIEKDPSVLKCRDMKGDSYSPNALVMICSQDYVQSKSGPDNFIDIIHLLIDKGVDVNNRLKDGWNALMAVCRYYRHANLIDIIQLLVKSGIDIDCKSHRGSNALLLLCANENLNHSICLDVVRLLVMDLKCDTNAVYEGDFENAITYLCKRHHNCDKLVDIIRLILDNSIIDVNHRNKNEESALTILRNRGKLVKNSSAIVKLLVQRNAQS